MPAIPIHDTAVVDQPWDAGEQVDKINTPVTKPVGEGEWAWFDPNSPDEDHDGGYPDAKSGYRFPHHLVSADGTPGAAVKAACSGALGRLSASNIPDSDQGGVRAHVQHHLDAYARSQAAARAEAFAASVVNEPEPELEASASPMVVEPGIVSAGYSDLDLARSGSPLELLLGKPWAITRQAAVEVATRLALQAQGNFRGDEQLARLQAAQLATAKGPAPRAQAQDGSEIAVIPLRGTITPRGSLFSLIFGGGGGLQLFREQVRMAVADGNVSAIVLDIDSPGGIIDLVPEATAELLSYRGSKPITAVANTTTASAAYWIASAADKVVATPSAQVGSIGVFTIHEDISRAEQAMGITTTIVSAGQFKTEGNPYEPLSKAAQANLQAEVDDLYGMFTGQVAQGRGVSQAAVQAGYGRGRCLLADQAMKVGMIDQIATLEQVVAHMGGSVPADPPVQPGDLEDCDDGPEAKADDADAPKPVAETTSPDEGKDQRDVCAPPVNYLSRPSRDWL